VRGEEHSHSGGKIVILYTLLYGYRPLVGLASQQRELCNPRRFLFFLHFRQTPRWSGIKQHSYRVPFFFKGLLLAGTTGGTLKESPWVNKDKEWCMISDIHTFIWPSCVYHQMVGLPSKSCATLEDFCRSFTL
jgi:hypothetical protein